MSTGNTPLDRTAIRLIAVALIPSVAEISPGRIRRFNQSDLLFPPPSLHFFLAANRGHNRAVTLEMNEPCHTAFCSESTEDVRFVLEDTLFDLAGHSNVEDTSLAAEDVNVLNPGHAMRMRGVSRDGR